MLDPIDKKELLDDIELLLAPLKLQVATISDRMDSWLTNAKWFIGVVVAVVVPLLCVLVGKL